MMPRVLRHWKNTLFLLTCVLTSVILFKRYTQQQYMVSEAVWTPATHTFSINETQKRKHAPFELHLFGDYTSNTRERPFTTAATSDVYIVSAIARNTTVQSAWDTMTVNAWEAVKYNKRSFKCCYMMKNETTVNVIVDKRMYWKKGVPLLSVQYQCEYNWKPDDVIGISVAVVDAECSPDMNKYVKPVFPLRQANQSLALCAKIVYGQPDSKLIIDWLEYYAELQVDKVVMFTYNISETTDRILQHYASIGFLILKKFDIPWKNSLKRAVGLKNPQAWQDEQVVVFDCQERLRGYNYVGFIDLDEFLLPGNHNNIKDMMTTLLKRHPKAAGFTFLSHIFVKNWGVTVPSNSSDIRKYFRRTKAVYTRWKSLYQPSRVETGTVHTHEFYPLPGYERIIPNASVAVINHYRQCWANYNRKCNRAIRYHDTRILKFVDRISARVNRTTTALLGSV